MTRSLFKGLGIHARVLSAAVILICGATLTLGYLGVNIINEFVIQRFDQRINFMAQYLALNCELGILIDERTLLQGLADNMLKEDDVQGVEIEDRQGRILVNAVRDILGPFANVEKEVFLSDTENNSTWINQLGNGTGKEYIGLVRVTYSIQGIEELVRRMTQRFIYIALVLTLFSGIIFYFISRSLVAPVIRLAKTAKKVSMGNQTIRAEQGSTPEIAKLAESFNEMLDSLAVGRKTLVLAHEKITRQEALAEVGKFSMMIAHEVKNPLGIIKSSLEMLKSDMDIPEDNIPLTYAEEEIVRLNDLIESFLMFSRPAKASFTPMDLNRMLEQIMMGFEIQYDSGDLQLKAQIPETEFMAEADFDLLSRAINNIIKNACEANEHKGAVQIMVSAIQKKWQLSVSDQGPGIDLEKSSRIFEPFFTTKAKGSGLGLAFADQVVKAHGGSIGVENLDGGGCCFCITLFANMDDEKMKVMVDDGLFTDRR